MRRHRHQEFIRFLNTVERAVSAGKVIHAIVDNYAAHSVDDLHNAITRYLDAHNSDCRPFVEQFRQSDLRKNSPRSLHLLSESAH
jgi:hypothetical protein